MFTHADFNHACRVICCAWIIKYGVRGAHFAKMVRFEPSGDVAWWVRGQFIAWPRQVYIHNRIGLTVYKFGIQDSCRMERP